jgi:hypothetical protein
VPGNAASTTATTNWYLKRIKLYNNGEIKFIYADEYEEIARSINPTYVHYGVPLQLPRMADPALQQQMDAAIAANGNNPYPQQYLDAKAYRDKVNSYYKEGSGNIIYDHAIQDAQEAMDDAFEMNAQYNTAVKREISNAIWHMYNDRIEVTEDMQLSGQYNVLLHKQVKQVITRNFIIEYSYHRVDKGGGDVKYFYSRVDYKTLGGDILKSVYFTYSRNGFLKNLQITNRQKEVENSFSFNYYNEDHNYGLGSYQRNSQDYWGFYNGKENSSTLPVDPWYSVANADYSGVTNFFSNTPVNFPMFNYITLQSLGDRRPDGEKAVARSLRSISTNKGEKITFEYEGNKVYSGSVKDNVKVGGIRIKSVEINNGVSPASKTQYKYDFPLLSNSNVSRSTGRYTQWHKRSFVVEYPFGTGTDHRVFGDPFNTGTEYEDNSNNGVLYHYVEVVNPDGSATGYKYSAVDDKAIQPDHFSIIDPALFATIDYDKDGNIKKVRRNSYAYPEIFLGDRMDELYILHSKFNYFTTINSRVATSSIPQIKKEPFVYDEEALLEMYPDKITSKTTFDGITYGLNPYWAVYMPNYHTRTVHTPQTISYNINTGNALLLSSTEEYLFGDYDKSVGYASSNFPSLPDEKAYLFERLLNANGIAFIKTSTSYEYGNLAHRHPTRIIKKDSKGQLLSERIKYVSDYQLTTDHPVSKMQQANFLSMPIERQKWLSVNNGADYKLVQGNLTSFSVIQKNGESRVVPFKSYLLTTKTPVASTDLGFSESYTGNAPFTNLMWENGTLYKLLDETNWQCYDDLSRPLTSIDKTGIPTEANLYNELTGDLILQAKNANGENICGLDLSPFNVHPGYSSQGIFQHAYIEQIVSPLNFSDIVQSGFPTDFTNLDFSKIASQVTAILVDFENNHPAEWGPVNNMSSYYYMRWFFEAMAEKRDLVEYTKALEGVMWTLFFAPNEEAYAMFGLENVGIPYTQMRQFMASFMQHSYRNGEFHPEIYEELVLNRVVSSSAVESRTISCKVASLVTNNTNLAFYYSGYLPKYRYKMQNGSYSSYKTLTGSMFKRGVFKGLISLTTVPERNNIESVEFYFDKDVLNGLYFIYALPEDAPFKATAYLPDHQPFVYFEHTGKVQYVEYDQMRRLHLIRDDKDNILQKTTYEYAINEPLASQLVPVIIENQNDISLLGRAITHISIVDNYTGVASELPVYVMAGQTYTIMMPKGIYWLYFKYQGNNQVAYINCENSTDASGADVYGQRNSYTRRVHLVDPAYPARILLKPDDTYLPGGCAVMYGSDPKFDNVSPQCDAGLILGQPVYVEVPAGWRTSLVSVADANVKVNADFPVEAQKYANDVKQCIKEFSSAGYVHTYTKQCDAGLIPKGTYNANIPEGMFTSVISQGDANAKAVVYANQQATNYLNVNGTCNKKIYAAVEVQNVRPGFDPGTTVGDLYIKIYADEAGTIPDEASNPLIIKIKRNAYHAGSFSGSGIIEVAYSVGLQQYVIFQGILLESNNLQERYEYVITPDQDPLPIYQPVIFQGSYNNRYYKSCPAGTQSDNTYFDISVSTGFTSLISQDDANAKAKAYCDAQAATYFATHGQCIPTHVYLKLQVENQFTDNYGSVYGDLVVNSYLDEQCTVPITPPNALSVVVDLMEIWAGWPDEPAYYVWDFGQVEFTEPKKVLAYNIPASLYSGEVTQVYSIQPDPTGFFIVVP